MITYILKRILLFFPTLLGIVLINFVVIQFVPGGPIEQKLAEFRHRAVGESGGGGMATDIRQLKSKGLDEEQLQYLKKLYGFDQPVYVRLWRWVYNLFTFNFGESYYHHRKVVDIVVEKLPVSASLGVISFFLTYLVCIPLGIYKAQHEGTRFDLVTSMIVLIGYSIPGFVLGVFMIFLFGGGMYFDIFPLRGLVSDDFASLSTVGKVLDYLHHLVLPIICLTIGNFAVLTMLTKNSILDNIKQQYALTARAKGVDDRIVLYKHVLRNSLIPLVTGFSGSFLTMLFAGSLLIEQLFSLDGLGLLSFESVISRDYPIVMANLFFFSLLFLVGNLMSDILYVIVDPRINFEQIAE